MEKRISSLISALRLDGDPVSLDLAGRLWRCQIQRVERRAGLRERVDRPCRSVACEHCRRWRGREWRERAADMMADADHEHASMVTIMIERTGDFESVSDVVADYRVALRNLRARRSEIDARWRRMSVVGLVELDMLDPGDLVLLPPQRRQVISSLPMRAHGEEITVVVHVHLMVSHPELPRRSIERVMEGQWPGRGRVHVGELHCEASVEDNAAGIIAYCAKHSMANTLTGDVSVGVPIALQASYWRWLHAQQRGLAPLRVRMSPMRDSDFVSAYSAVSEVVQDVQMKSRMVTERMPMPIVW